MWLLASCLALLALAPATVDAQEAHGEGEHSAEAGDHASGYHGNHIAIFVGVTDEEAENAFSLGLDYERRLTRRFGIGVLTDYAFGEVRAFVIGVPIFFHATDRLKFLLAPGFEDADAHDRETLIRIGGEYSFEMTARWSIAPTFNIDIVEDEEIFVFGVNFGRGF